MKNIKIIANNILKTSSDPFVTKIEKIKSYIFEISYLVDNLTPNDDKGFIENMKSSFRNWVDRFKEDLMNMAIKEVNSAKVEDEINLTKYMHKYLKMIRFEEDQDLGYTYYFDTGRVSLTNWPTKGHNVIHWKNLDNAKKHCIANRLQKNDFINDRI